MIDVALQPVRACAFFRHRAALGPLAIVFTCARLAAACTVDGPLQMPSPDWSSQVVYFAMIDRFDDGDPHNNDQGAGEYDPADPRKYSGGDLAGLARRLDYIQELGATALWITPPVANQWWDARHAYGGYHGYWAEDFTRVDAHLGTREDVRCLSRALHARHMALVQDIVVNHVGNYFTIDRTGRFSLNSPTPGRSAPTQWPFSRNDANDPAQRRLGIYHWTADIGDFNDERQLRTGQLAGLDDLDTENPRVRRALRSSYGGWIRDAGIDAFRIDTVLYVQPAFFDDFLHADDAHAPGILRVAEATGHRAFLAFGEGFAIDAPYRDDDARRIEAYMAGTKGRERLPGMLNFPLYGSTLDVFARGRPSAVLGERIRSMMRVHARPWLMPTFVDNHDVDRFLANAGEASLRQALLLIMTLPGIPVIYQGTEQGFTGQRDAMFARGFGSGGRDHFDVDAPMYRYLQRVIALRRSQRALTHGAPTVLAESRAASGPLAYAMRDNDDAVIVAFNPSPTPRLLARLRTAFAAGTTLDPLFAIDGDAPALVVGADGLVDVVLPAHSGYAWKAGAVGAAAPTANGDIAVAPLPARVTGDLVVAGRAHGVDRVTLVVDGDIERARTTDVGPGGAWRAGLPTADATDPAVEHELVAWSDAPRAVAGPLRFRVERQWRELARLDDAAGDDHGPGARYTYPTGAGWTSHPLDVRSVRVRATGTSLRIELRFATLGSLWKAPNGFDHLAANVFVELPGRRDGVRSMPLQDALLPEGMRWHVRARVDGWNVALFDAAGADATHEGTPRPAAPALKVDTANATLIIDLPASSLGDPATLDGARVHVATWDRDGGYRPLRKQADAGSFGGRVDAHDPLVMDDAGPIVLRE